MIKNSISQVLLAAKSEEENGNVAHALVELLPVVLFNCKYQQKYDFSVVHEGDPKLGSLN